MSYFAASAAAVHKFPLHRSGRNLKVLLHMQLNGSRCGEAGLGASFLWHTSLEERAFSSGFHLGIMT
jgi:hypothetical protein